MQQDGPGNAGDAPHLIMAKSAGTVVGYYIQVDMRLINCNTVDFIDAMVKLILAYYAFDARYPRIYANFLGFVQRFVVEDESSSFECSQGFRLFCEKF